MVNAFSQELRDTYFTTVVEQVRVRILFVAVQLVSLFSWDLFTQAVAAWHWDFAEHICIIHLTPVMLHYLLSITILNSFSSVILLTI
jgi:hypothetical protein